jgi:pimeloyl-ACP methyl ester carboxylesterase
MQLKPFVAGQAPHYGEIQTPTTVITGDVDNTVSHRIHAEVIGAMLPRGTLIVLPGVGHMPHHAAPEMVIKAIDELARAK